MTRRRPAARRPRPSTRSSPACWDRRPCEDGLQRSADARGVRQQNLAASVNRLPPERNREAMDDDELIAAVAGGDDRALRELFSRHAPWLAARLRGVLPAAEVEDVLQETFLAVWRGARGYRPGGSAGAWLWGIARRQAALWLRRRGPAELLLPALVAADGRRPGRSGGGGLGQGGPRRCCQRTGAGGRCAA